MATQAQIEAARKGQAWQPLVLQLFDSIDQELIDQIYFEFKYIPLMGGGLNLSYEEIDSLSLGRVFDLYDKLIERRNTESKAWLDFFAKINGAKKR